MCVKAISQPTLRDSVVHFGFLSVRLCSVKTSPLHQPAADAGCCNVVTCSEAQVVGHGLTGHTKLSTNHTTW